MGNEIKYGVILMKHTITGQCIPRRPGHIIIAYLRCSTMDIGL